MLQEGGVLLKHFQAKTVQLYCFAQSFPDFVGGVFDLLVLCDHASFNLTHFLLKQLNRIQLPVWISFGYFFKYLKYPFVLRLELEHLVGKQSVLVGIVPHLFGVLNFVETPYEFMCETIDPVGELTSRLNQGGSYLRLPLSDQSH